MWIHQTWQFFHKGLSIYSLESKPDTFLDLDFVGFSPPSRLGIFSLPASILVISLISLSSVNTMNKPSVLSVLTSSLRTRPQRDSYSTWARSYFPYSPALTSPVSVHLGFPFTTEQPFQSITQLTFLHLVHNHAPSFLQMTYWPQTMLYSQKLYF